MKLIKALITIVFVSTLSLSINAKEIKMGKVKPVGYVAKSGGLQGYLIDKKTADKFNIKSVMAVSYTHLTLPTSDLV